MNKKPGFSIDELINDNYIHNHASPTNSPSSSSSSTITSSSQSSWIQHTPLLSSSSSSLSTHNHNHEMVYATQCDNVPFTFNPFVVQHQHNLNLQSRNRMISAMIMPENAANAAAAAAAAAFFLHNAFRKPKRIRTAFTPSQLLKLESAFESNHYVVGQERKELAKLLNLSETQVKVWFQNRRTKHKRGKYDDEDDEQMNENVNNDDDDDDNEDDYMNSDDLKRKHKNNDHHLIDYSKYTNNNNNSNKTSCMTIDKLMTSS